MMGHGSVGVRVHLLQDCGYAFVGEWVLVCQVFVLGDVG